MTNLYFNDHLDLNLAEQDALSCSGAGSCAGGWPGLTLNYVTNTGIVDENCFPYTHTDEDCSNKCSVPSELIKINGKVTFSSPKTEEKLKNMIIDYGAVSGGISSWRHAMTLVGYDTDPDDGQTVWIFKNSWGEGWGEHGYGYVKTPISNINWTHALMNPVTSATPYDISCVDNDGDGFYNWGISAIKPPTCPSAAFAEKDCDDGNPYLGPSESNGFCKVLNALPPPLTTLVGDKDNIHPGDPADAAPKSHRIKEILDYIDRVGDIVGQNPGVDLDEGGFDRPVGLTHFFYLPEQALIMSAKLTIRIKGQSTLVYNDVIMYDESVSPSETDPACLQDPPTRPPCDPQQFYPLILLRDLLGKEPQIGEVHEVEMDLSKVPVRVSGDPGPGGHWPTDPDEYRNLLSLLYDGEFNLVIADDATVDYSELSIIYVLPAAERQGDLDGNNLININDYRIFRALLGKRGGHNGYTPLADYDGDGRITYADYRMWYGLYKNQ